MDLEDPCHSINLSLSKALETLPKEVTKFIKKIHSHFSYPQRVAYLCKVQKENNFEVLSPVHFVPTRWLSMGQSLARLLHIWNSLQEYMKQKLLISGSKKVKKKHLIISRNY